LENWEINGICGKTVKAVAENTMTVSDWKERELKRLKECFEKLSNNISMLESLDVEEVQTWMDGLRNNAKEYIETAVEHEYE
jgi:L-2-hydroxyglutarate oxidase LhgO